MKLFLLLGNQLFSPKYLNDFKDHTFFMAEDYGLCTFEKHHKLKILLFLSSMRSYRDELKSKNYNFSFIEGDISKSDFPKELKKDLLFLKKLSSVTDDSEISQDFFFLRYI